MVQKARYGFPPSTRYERLETLPIITTADSIVILEIRVYLNMYVTLYFHE